MYLTQHNTSRLSLHLPPSQAIFPLGPSFGPIGIKETKMLANVFATRVGAMPMPGIYLIAVTACVL